MLDVVIPVYKPGKEFKSVLNRLLKQKYSINKIFLINTEEEFFDTDFLFDDKINVCHITKAEFDHGATRQMGMEMSKADYVLFMTMDAVPADANMTKELVSALENSNIAVAYARQLPKKKCRMSERFTREFNYPDESMVKTKTDINSLGIKTYFCSDVCAMYNRKLFFENGGFEKNMIFNEDMVYAATAIDKGYGVAYCAKAMVYHSHNYNCIEQLKRNFDMGVSQADYKHIFDAVPAEKEGVRLVLNTAKYLLQNGHWYEVPYLFLNSAAKFIGYKLGRNYKKLPRKIILKLTSNVEYWKKVKV